MSVKETPIAKVKRLHGGKEKLVDSLVADLARESEDESKDELKQRLMTVSNKKLMRLSEALKQLNEQYGSKDKLVEAVSAAKGKSKDEDYVNKLRTYTIPRLLDMARTGKARSKRAS